MKFRFPLLIAVLIQTSSYAQTTMNIYKTDGTLVQIPINLIDSVTHTIGSPNNLAVLSTTTLSAITSASAVSGGNITNDGGSAVSNRGICWSSSPNPTTADHKSTDGNGAGSFASNLSGLNSNTLYYVRAYATNSAGTAYGNELSFTTTNLTSTAGSGVTDIDGNAYQTIVLGNGQEWMAESLKTTSYANGDPIPNITVDTIWAYLTTGAWSYYNNDSQFNDPYGKLYNWYTTVDSRNVCPVNWHVPSESDWLVFVDYIGGVLSAGGKMKSTGTIQNADGLWNSPNVAATNESGFSLIPGGFRSNLGNFVGMNNNGTWWSSTGFDVLGSWTIHISFNYAYAFNYNFNKVNGYAVRCVKD